MFRAERLTGFAAHAHPIREQSAPWVVSSKLSSMPNPLSLKVPSGRVVSGLALFGMGWGLVATASLTIGQEVVLADFNDSGFDYTFEGFSQSLGDSAVRLLDPNDGWGGAGVVEPNPLDFSGFAEGRLVVDIVPLAANSAPDFTIELIEQIEGSQTQVSGKWTFSLDGLAPGVPTRLVAPTRLGSPSSGLGDFQNLDLASIQQWQVLGPFGSPEPFDVIFDRIAIDTNAPAYPGAEPDAPWRADAAARIEANRKANLSVNVVDAAGLPVPGAQVGVEMQRHEFGFGSAVQGFRLRDEAPQHAAYKAKVAELFNVATLENNLKWPPWEGEWGGLWTQSGAVAALDWLNAQGIDGRGHAMVWPGESNLPADLRQMLADDSLSPAEQSSVRQRIAAHIASVGGAAAGKVVAWDVINETRTNNDLMRLLDEGDQALVTWFQQARAADPDAALYLNDFGILNSWGGASASNRDTYLQTLQYLKDQGAPIDGVGFQGHFSGDDITGPEELWSILDRFDELGLDMQVTEFDINTTDEQLQAQYTRDFLTAMFAHEGVDDVILWGFWEDAHWRPDAAMFRSDWSIKPNGEAYLDLVFDEWWTDESFATGADGGAIARAFRGEHRVSAAAGEFSAETTVELNEDGTTTLVLAMLVGDFNRDGRVDAADYSVWRNALETQDPSGDANNDGLVDSADYDLWRSRYGLSLPPEAAATIPEPSAAGLVGSLFLAFHARRRQSPHVA